MLPQYCFDLSTDQHGYERFDARGSLYFCAFARIDLLDEFDRRVGLTRQTFDFRIRTGGTVHGLVAYGRCSIFHASFYPEVHF